MKLIQAGWTQADVATAAQVTDRTVRRWVAAFRESGVQGLQAKPPTPTPSRLSPTQQQHVLSWIVRDTRDFGFSAELWTSRRLAQVIERAYGVRYNHRYLCSWLLSHGMTAQKPRRQAWQRDQE